MQLYNKNGTMVDRNGVAQVQTGFDRSFVKFRNMAVGATIIVGVLLVFGTFAFRVAMNISQINREAEHEAYLAANPEVACKNKYQMDLFNAGKCKYGKCLGVSMANLVAPAGYCGKP